MLMCEFMSTSLGYGSERSSEMSTYCDSRPDLLTPISPIGHRSYNEVKHAALWTHIAQGKAHQIILEQCLLCSRVTL